MFRNVSDFPGQENQWLSANVPSNVHMDLLDQKIITDPYFSTDNEKVNWVDHQDWEYQLNFNILDAKIL